MNQFLQKLLLQVLSGLVVAVVMFLLLIPFKNTLDQLTELATSIEGSVNAITKAVDIDPTKINDVSDAVKNGSEVIGQGVGEGTATAIGKIKEALGNSTSE